MRFKRVLTAISATVALSAGSLIATATEAQAQADVPGAWHQVSGTAGWKCGPTGGVSPSIAPLSYTSCIKVVPDSSGSHYLPGIFVRNRNESRQFRIVGTTLQLRINNPSIGVVRDFVDCQDSTIAAGGTVICWPSNTPDFWGVLDDDTEANSYSQITSGPTVASPNAA